MTDLLIPPQDNQVLFPHLEVIDTAHLDPNGPRRDEWLELRRSGIGGSDVGAIFGVNPYKSAVEVWLDKTGRIPDRDLSDNEAVRWGILLEGLLADEFAHRTGFTVWNPKAMFRDPRWPHMIANPDRLFYDDKGRLGVLEIKTAGHFQSDEWTDERIPDSYELQVLHYAAVLGVDVAYICVLVAGQRFRAFPVERDDELIDDLRLVEQAFWEDHIVADEPPPVDSSEACTDALARMWKADPGSVINLGDEALDIVARYWEAHAAIKEAKEAKDQAGNELRMLLGPHEVGLVDGKPVVTWKAGTRREFDEAGFKAAAGWLHDAWMRTVPTRTLRPSRKSRPSPPEPKEPTDGST